MQSRLFLFALLATAACTQSPPATTSVTAPALDPAAEDRRLVAFLDAAFDEAVALSPETMTGLGLKTDYDKLDDYTPAAGERARALDDKQLAEMKARFDYAKLSAAGQLNYRLFEKNVERGRRQYPWRWYAFPISTNGTPAGDIPAFLINQHRIDSVADAEAYVSRIRETERVMREIGDNVRMQAVRGIVPPKMVFAPARADARSVLEGAPFAAGEDGSLLADFAQKVGKLDASDADKARLVADARAALTGPFKRGFDTFFATLDAIEPKARGNDGAWSLPDGGAYYASRLENSTTTDLTADRIHAIGLEQVKRIHAEMDAVRERIGLKGSLQDFFTDVRTNPKYKYPNTDAGRERYLSDARGYVAQVMAAAPRWFHRLPKAALEVRAVETWRQDTAAVAFYNQPAPDGSRPGIFYVNLADINQVQRPQIEAFTYHEGAPGHHFQIARAQELAEMPKFRRFGFSGAYTEGWGLYSERLGKEMGFYQDPLSEFGMLSAQLWRAIRLVVDTGLHARRWSRDQAIGYFRDNSPLSERDIVKEVDRYINNPGQATSYMIGQLKIDELRDRARAALGARFDIRDFHEVVLANGAMPLDVLEEQVDAYIAANRS